MDTKDLRCFCRVYEERGINQAAKQLFISSQGLSRIIAKLEAELQVTLFERSVRGLCPTASGSYLYENCRELLEKLEDIEIGIHRIERMDRELRLGFSCGVLNVFPYSQIDFLQGLPWSAIGQNQRFPSPYSESLPITANCLYSCSSSGRIQSAPLSNLASPTACG